jgi:hypothetical protein
MCATLQKKILPAILKKRDTATPQREEGNFGVKMSDKNEEINLINCTRKGQVRNF